MVCHIGVEGPQLSFLWTFTRQVLVVKLDKILFMLIKQYETTRPVNKTSWIEDTVTQVCHWR